MSIKLFGINVVSTLLPILFISIAIYVSSILVTPVMSQPSNEFSAAGFRYSLDCQENFLGYFTSVKGIGSESEVVEHKVVNADGRQLIMKVPGRLKWNDITLSRGITDSMDIWNWRSKIEDGKIDEARANCSIVMYDQNLTPVAQWEIERAWPSRVGMPEIDQSSDGFLLESITITYDFMRRVQ